MGQSDASLIAVNTALDGLEGVELVWRHGLLHQGGPHRRLAGMFSPISIGEDECAALGRLITQFRPARCLVIGNGFGFSACYLAYKMRDLDGISVVAMDNQGEGDGRRCAEVARELTNKLTLGLLRNVGAQSPEDIEDAVEGRVNDLILIDGNHHHPQPTRDFEGALPVTSSKGIIVWHDFWLWGVAQGIEVARKRGFRTLWLPTSCELVLGTRDNLTFQTLRTLFPFGIEDRPAHWKSFGQLILWSTKVSYRVTSTLIRTAGRWRKGRPPLA